MYLNVNGLKKVFTASTRYDYVVVGVVVLVKIV